MQARASHLTSTEIQRGTQMVGTCDVPPRLRPGVALRLRETGMEGSMANKQTGRVGRPPIGKTAATRRIVVRVDDETLRAWRGTASVLGMSLSAWIRRRCGE